MMALLNIKKLRETKKKLSKIFETPEGQFFLYHAYLFKEKLKHNL